MRTWICTRARARTHTHTHTHTQVNQTFAQFELDRLVDVGALGNVSLAQMGAVQAELVRTLARPLPVVTGSVCEQYQRESSCLFRAVTCNVSGFPAALAPARAFNCSGVAAEVGAA